MCGEGLFCNCFDFIGATGVALQQLERIWIEAPYGAFLQTLIGLIGGIDNGLCIPPPGGFVTIIKRDKGEKDIDILFVEKENNIFGCLGRKCVAVEKSRGGKFSICCFLVVVVSRLCRFCFVKRFCYMFLFLSTSIITNNIIQLRYQRLYRSTCITNTSTNYSINISDSLGFEFEF